jgi:superfamily II DNA/RNA helicase
MSCGISTDIFVLSSFFRFDEFGISPLTVKALTDAGYVQTTVVQEAALPVCLEGSISYFTFFKDELHEIILPFAG